MIRQDLANARFTALSRPLTRAMAIGWLTRMAPHFQAKGMVVVSIKRENGYKQKIDEYICYRVLTERDHEEKKYLDYRQGMIVDITFMEYMSCKKGTAKSGHNVKIKPSDMIDFIAPDKIEIKPLTGY